MNTLKYQSHSQEGFRITLNKRVKEYFSTTPNGRKATPFMWLKIISVLSLFWLNWYQLAFKTHSALVTIVHLALGALLYMIIAYSIAHDAAHLAITGNKKIDGFIFFISFNVLGANYYLWRMRHNYAHHSTVNVPGWDLDIEGTSIIRFAPHIPWKKIHRFQHLYASVLYMFFTLQWIIIKDFKIMRMKSIGSLGEIKHSPLRWVELVLLKLAYFGYTIIIPAAALPYSLMEVVTTFILFHFAFSYLLTISFVFSHIGVATEFVFPDKDGNLPHSFLEHQLRTSVDFHAQNRLFGFIFGGFNAHVAHHMFSNVSSTHYADLSKIIKTTAKEYSLPYSELSLPKMVASHYQFLKQMGASEAGTAKNVIFTKMESGVAS